MPTYEYICEKCDVKFAHFQSIKDEPLKVCPKEKCGLKKWGKGLRNLYFLMEANSVFEQTKAFTGYNTESSTPGYVLLNSGLGADLVSRKGTTLASLHFAVNNLTDKADQGHLSRLKYTAVNQVTGRQGVFNMGRNFSVKLNVPNNFL